MEKFLLVCFVIGAFGSPLAAAQQGFGQSKTPIVLIDFVNKKAFMLCLFLSLNLL